MHIGILGGGAWGTALAQVARRGGREVRLWCRSRETAAAIDSRCENPRYLPGQRLEPGIAAGTELAEVAGWAEALLLVVPAQTLRATAGALRPLLTKPTPLVICCKGLERGSGLLPSEVLAEALPGHPLAVLSGPTFAGEVAAGLPAAATLAGRDETLVAALVEGLGSASFRPYRSDDPVGVELGGAVKNVIAIACGIVAGRKLGENARAALITRGLAEIARLVRAKGGRMETVMGLSGLGDLTLTCNSPTSRNFSFGLRLGEGVGLEAAGRDGKLVEGAASAAAVVELAAQLDVDLPVSVAVDAVVNRGADIEATIRALLARPLRDEFR